MEGTRNRRTRGTGSIIIRGGSYYGKWWLGNRQVMRKLGRVRVPGTRDGLTRTEAEKRLRELVSEVKWVAPDQRLSFGEVAAKYVDHVEHVMERKPSTVRNYRSISAVHLSPYFGGRDIRRISSDDFAAYIKCKSREGLSSKSISHHVVLAHGVFSFAVKHGLASANPVAAVDRPRPAPSNPDFRYLRAEEFEALLRAVPDDYLGQTDRVLYLTAVMTGLRQGELVALRWRDVDWTGGRIRVRQSYTGGHWGTPKSRRSSRAVPMADRLAGELERHFQNSAYQGDDDLVMPHPRTGHPYDPSKILTRFYSAMKRAGLGHLAGLKNGITFHSLRHTYGTRMASVGTPMRTLQEWMGHCTIQTTEIYADYLPNDEVGCALTNQAFGSSTDLSTKLSETESYSDELTTHN
jgi:integrase